MTALEAEVTAERLRFSDEQVAELDSRARKADEVLLNAPEQLGSELEAISAAATRRHWTISFHVPRVPSATPSPDIAVGLLAAHGSLTCSPGAHEPFSDLVAWLRDIEAGPKRIDLTQLDICVDEGGKYAAEANLRLGCRIAP